MNEATFDLSALADHLKAKGRSKMLVHAIRDMTRFYSLQTDLRAALECCDTLKSLGPMDEATDRRAFTMAHALQCNALILYARATHTSSNERKPSNLLHRFTKEQKCVHQELVDLRNSAVAHYGSGGSYKGVWKIELAVLYTRDEHSIVGATTRRVAADPLLTNRLYDQAALCLDIIVSMQQEKTQLVTTLLNEALLADPAFDEVVRSHKLDLDSLLITREAGARARASFDGGMTFGVTRGA